MTNRWSRVFLGMALGTVVFGWSIDGLADQFRRPDGLVIERGYKKPKLKPEVGVCAEHSVVERVRDFAAQNVPDWDLDVRDAATLSGDVDRRDFSLVYIGFSDDDPTTLDCAARFPELTGAVGNAMADATSRRPLGGGPQTPVTGSSAMHMTDSISFAPMEGGKALMVVAICYNGKSDCIVNLLPRIFGLDRDFCKQGPVCN